ncbi:hypothetical protein GGF31_002789 [Allomyces arbusculus]|nr:hypothetical protein GGF31_002789 [Allomyces arbusculus]
MNTLVEAIGETISDVVSRDLVIAHTMLLVAFHSKLQVTDNEVKDLPIRYADDMCRRYGRIMLRFDFPLMRLAKAVMSNQVDDQDAGRTFWTANLPANQPDELTPTTIDETKAKGNVMCPSCQAEQTLTMPEYAAFRLHSKARACTSCEAAFTVENVAVRRFLDLVAHQPMTCIAGTQTHPKTFAFAGTNQDNTYDLAVLFERTDFAKHADALPALATWAGLMSIVFKPIMAAKAEALVLPGNKYCFARVIASNQDVLAGPWSIDMIRAVRRQRRFASKMADLVTAGAHAVYHFHTEALMQYP